MFDEHALAFLMYSRGGWNGGLNRGILLYIKCYFYVEYILNYTDLSA